MNCALFRTVSVDRTTGLLLDFWNLDFELKTPRLFAHSPMFVTVVTVHSVLNTVFSCELLFRPSLLQDRVVNANTGRRHLGSPPSCLWPPHISPVLTGFPTPAEEDIYTYCPTAPLQVVRSFSEHCYLYSPGTVPRTYLFLLSRSGRAAPSESDVPLHFRLSPFTCRQPSSVSHPLLFFI